MNCTVQVSSKDPVIQFARQELERYINEIDIDHRACNTANIKIGLFSEMLHERNCGMSEFDDEIYINIHEGSGIVAGINPRSCLLAVYRLLQEAGCEFCGRERCIFKGVGDILFRRQL